MPYGMLPAPGNAKDQNLIINEFWLNENLFLLQKQQILAYPKDNK
jgi:hypothetical protein